MTDTRPTLPSIPLPPDPADLDAGTIAALRQVLNVPVLLAEVARLAHEEVHPEKTA